MKEGDPYCGFACGDIIERQESILKDIDDFAEYNPEFAQVMRFRIAKLCLQALEDKIESEGRSTIAIKQ